MFSISLAVLIALIVIAKKHQVKKQQNYAAQALQAQNIVYSDSHQQPNQYQPQQNQYNGRLQGGVAIN